MIVLLTGAAGLIGAEVAARLAAKGAAVIGLVHRNPNLTRNNGRPIRTVPWNGAPRPGTVTTVTGDVTQPRLGLEQYNAIREAADIVVHCAAITDFGRAQHVYDGVNVNGTDHVLRLVRPRDARPVPLVHVSTAYVCGEHEGTFREADLDTGQSFGTAYEQSKFRAETMVREAQEGGLPAAVVRPSIVVGAERTGVVREFQNMYVVLKALTEGRVRSIPGYYDAHLDLVPVDYVADVVVEATLRFAAAEGRTFHALGAAPHTLRDFSDVLAEYPTFHVPRYIPPSSFSAEKLPATERIYYERIVGLYETYFRRTVVHENVNAAELLGRKPGAQGLPYLRRLLDHALKVGYLGTPLPSVDEALAGLAKEGR
ncbi:SDR family oxidoreductase [Actinomadura macrotermitis]|uniref:Thioester reductase (TE) domain-containing protein n=1 Tax=Actinomadura macrotermitis TaxID=2585200 RepID=A0A7K0BVE7_9ACTN|nr:SDR family oxidoreductase [Actinomadura macrotermitis]MQY05046.1 hypothetical protein [Actinomadura macrotermitis]